MIKHLKFLYCMICVDKLYLDFDDMFWYNGKNKMGRFVPKFYPEDKFLYENIKEIKDRYNEIYFIHGF